MSKKGTVVLKLMLVLPIHVSDTQLEVTCKKLMSAADGSLCTQVNTRGLLLDSKTGSVRWDILPLWYITPLTEEGK